MDLTYKKLKNKRYNFFSIAPARAIVISFAILILLGAILLSMPFSSRSGEWTPFVNSLFTSASASCITGLVVYDTYGHWSIAGQIIILLLIQIGALGIITLATFFSILLRKKVGIRGMILAKESINFFSYPDVLEIIKKIVKVTFIFEFIGAVILSASFVPEFGAIGLYMGIFTSISAFCNAGFDVTSAAVDGSYLCMIPFNDNLVVMNTVSVLIIIGGLGFSVWRDLYEYRIKKQLTFYTKLVLFISALLLVLGALFFFVNEYNNPKTMGSMSVLEKINTSFFHSASIRTAGFYSINFGDMKEMSKVFSVFLMFVGAAPGSTAGGIKVTTLGVLVMAVFSQIRGSDNIVLFKNRINQQTVNKALSITGLSIIFIMVITTVIVSIQPFHFIDILFEITSAFGTAGLSIGVVPLFNSASKALLILAMFFGRVGSLSFAVALTMKQSRRNSDMVYPEAKILVG
ncbi:trk system potassium uptake protein TrkH [Ruminiclostridium sufflavum DSM 19573]|uniref:Trk system potassium uptake protein TrkH n=1 Tax=Ruminiclostridium sufflavum DSM 19573 TaxID=1121337 RepID=A0A318XH66_9FIRM|nr:potassium transporter TrkG [Ruminiclostridium sufflavum]PYG85925.1 trk system potassium uptake protein TrkH [Ruminiclostridium sufflavum DSM 19573]